MIPLTERQLVQLGEDLGRRLPVGAVVWLEGELGAGKTTLVQAIVGGRGGPGAEVRSPTYTLVHRYDGPFGQIAHVDCYRFATPDEGAEIDWADLAAGDLMLVEWPTLGGHWVPSPNLRILLKHTAAGDLREVVLSGGPLPDLISGGPTGVRDA